MAAALEVSHLTKRYWDFTLDDFSLTIPECGVTGIIGPSGAGKTTLMNLIMNLASPDAGEIVVFGLPLSEHEKEIKNRIGYVGEDPLFDANRTVSWTGHFVAGFFESWNGSRFRSLLEEFGVASHKKVKDLSRGRTTLLGVAIALSHEADLYLLDEPTAGLDLVARRRVLELLSGLAEDEGKTVILSSHNTEGVAEIADRVVFINEGRLILHEEREDLMGRWKWIHYRDGALADDILTTLSRREQRPFSCKGLTANYPALCDRLADSIAAGDVRVENVDLGEILISMIEGN